MTTKLSERMELTPEVGSFLQRAENLLVSSAATLGLEDPQLADTAFWQRLIPT